MSRTINGKELKTVMEELKEPFKKYAVDFNGKPNIPYEVIRNRANEVLGFNYSTEIDVQTYEVETEYDVRVSCKITIYDDDGNLVATRSHMRSDILTRYSKDHKMKALKICFDNDDFSSVVSLAFKKTFSMFGLGDQFAMEKATGSMNHVVADSKNDDSTIGTKNVKSVVSFISKINDEEGNGEIFTFQFNEGRMMDFKVVDREKISNYAKLAALAPGSQCEIKFTLPCNTFRGIA